MNKCDVLSKYQFISQLFNNVGLQTLQSMCGKHSRVNREKCYSFVIVKHLSTPISDRGKGHLTVPRNICAIKSVLLK